MAESSDVVISWQTDVNRHDNPDEECSLPLERNQKIEDYDDDDVVEKEESINDLCKWLRDLYPNGCSNEKNVYYKYFREISDSKGFDISGMPTTEELHGLPLRKVELEKLESEGKNLDDIVNCAKSAITHYNNRKGTNYKFVKLVKANSRSWDFGVNFHLTIEAEDDLHKETFQALVWWGWVPKKICSAVKFCRIRAPSAAARAT